MSLCPVSGAVRRPHPQSGVPPAVLHEYSALLRCQQPIAALSSILVVMKASALGIIAAAAAAFPVHVLLILLGATAGLILLIYLGIALPAVWSAKPARRKAATTVLRLILDACTHDRLR
jgi:hypothetical protein